jgi:hypothetical protein
MKYMKVYEYMYVSIHKHANIYQTCAYIDEYVFMHGSVRQIKVNNTSYGINSHLHLSSSQLSPLLRRNSVYSSISVPTLSTLLSLSVPVCSPSCFPSLVMFNSTERCNQLIEAMHELQIENNDRRESLRNLQGGMPMELEEEKLTLL